MNVYEKHDSHFSHFHDKGRIFTFNYGHTSFTSAISPESWVSCWENWEIVE